VHQYGRWYVVAEISLKKTGCQNLANDSEPQSRCGHRMGRALACASGHAGRKATRQRSRSSWTRIPRFRGQNRRVGVAGLHHDSRGAKSAV